MTFMKKPVVCCNSMVWVFFKKNFCLFKDAVPQKYTQENRLSQPLGFMNNTNADSL